MFKCLNVSKRTGQAVWAEEHLVVDCHRGPAAQKRSKAFPAKNGLFEPFILKTIILARQARDKHRESTQKRCRFSHLVRVEEELPRQDPAADAENAPSLSLSLSLSLFTSQLLHMFVPSLSW